jgi:hypothetical protein
MGKPDQEWAKRRVEAKRDERHQNRQNPKVVEQIQREAKAAGATLAHDGKGGLDPKLALKVFRAAHWRCENPYCPTPKKDLDLDHWTAHPKEIFQDKDTIDDAKLRKGVKESGGKKDDRFVHAICAACHDRVHERERAIEKGKKPAPMRGT